MRRSPVAPDAAAHFLHLAEEYGSLIDTVEAVGEDDLLRRLSRLLPALLLAAEDLPEVEPGTEEVAPTTDHKSWAERFEAVGAVLGDKVDYWTTSDVIGNGEPEALCLTLADDLADIWSDLRQPLLLLESGGELSDAAWEWRFHASIHWGSHAVEALRVVHALTR